MPMPTRSGRPSSASSLRIDAIERQVDGARRAQRLPASGLDAVALTEHGQQAVAEELVDPAAVAVMAAPTTPKNSLSTIDDVEGQPASPTAA